MDAFHHFFICEEELFGKDTVSYIFSYFPLNDSVSQNVVIKDGNASDTTM